MNAGRKYTGAKYHARRKKRLHERKGVETKISLAETKIKKIRTRGGHTKQKALRTNIVNLTIDKKAKKVEIKNVLETPQNAFLARQNILFKGSVIETSEGKAKITNRPGQEGFINAVLIKQ